MRNKRFILLSLMAMILMVAISCHSNNKYDQMMERVDSIMNENDESATLSIKILDSIKPQMGEFTKAQKMRYTLLYHKAMNKAEIPFTSDSAMLKVKEYYELYGNSNEKMLAYYVMGCVYRDLHEAPLALEYYEKATEQADTSSNTCDYATLCRTYSQMGVLFSLQFLPEQMKEALSLASHFAYKAKDTLNAIIYYENINSAYSSLNQLDSAILINLDAYQQFMKHGYEYQAKIAFGSNYPYYLRLGKLNLAKQAFYIYHNTGYEGNTNYGSDAEANLLCSEGSFYLLNHQLDSAYISLTKAFSLSESYIEKANSAKGLAHYFIQVNKPALAAKYALLNTEYNDSDIIEIRNSQLHQLKALYDYNRNKDLAMKAEAKAMQRNNFIYMMIIGGILILMLILTIYHKSISKRKQQVRMIQQLYNDSLQKLHITEKELNDFKNLNETKINQLIQEKEQELQILLAENTKYKKHLTEHSLVEINKQIEMSIIYNRFKYLEQHTRDKVTQKDWADLETLLENLVIGLAELKHKLNMKEYHICLLIKLNFSPSTISSIIGTSLSDITNSRTRMFAKIFKKEGKAKDFDNFIKQLT